MEIEGFITNTIGILVFFIGVVLTKRFRFLREFNIPEPVTGGLLAALVVFAIYVVYDIEINFDLGMRDLLLVYFFTTIGLNARLSDLIAGGKPLLILLALTLSYIVIQNLIGIGGANALGLPSEVGVMAGSASLIGGHGTAIAWAPDVVDRGVSNAMEIGVACATMGLVVASLIGGPIARVLLNRYNLKGDKPQEPMVGIEFQEEKDDSICHLSFMTVIFVIHICVIIGYVVNTQFEAMGLKLPLFVTCLLTGILLSNTVPNFFPKIPWPARTPSLALVSDLSLSLFLTLSLMSMQLWTIAGLAGPLLIILALQTLGALIYIFVVVFPLMGKNYQAAVLSAGFGGFALGATPTAIANMTAVTKAHGPAPMAFIILPLVAAFFVDITNAFVIQFALGG